MRWIGVLLLLLAAPARAADITVLSAGAIHSVAAAVAPAFEARTGDKVTMRNDTVGGLVHRIGGGETFDVVLMSPAGLEELAKINKIVPGSQVKLAEVGVGVGIRSGSPRPDISSAAAFKATMLRVGKVAYIDPASGASSGIYLRKLFQSMGIADAMARKSVLVKGGLAAQAVLDGRADIVLQQISEIVGIPGITLVGPLPAEIQNVTIYAGAIGAGSSSADAAQAFLADMSGPPAKAALAAKGMSPP